MIEAVIQLLIYVCVLALVVYLIIWVLTDVIGVPVPAKVIQILWVIVALVALLMILRIIPFKMAKADRLPLFVAMDANGGISAPR